MKIERYYTGYATHKYRVVLETPEERDFPDSRIISACDQRRDDEERWERELNGAHPGHFGGHVTRWPDTGECDVSVYVD